MKSNPSLLGNMVIFYRVPGSSPDPPASQVSYSLWKEKERGSCLLPRTGHIGSEGRGQSLTLIPRAPSATCIRVSGAPGQCTVMVPISHCPKQETFFKNCSLGTSLVVQWIRIHLPLQEMWVLIPGPGRFHMPWSNLKPMSHKY